MLERYKRGGTRAHERNNKEALNVKLRGMRITADVKQRYMR
mgnify:CR=1 FL=1